MSDSYDNNNFYGETGSFAPIKSEDVEDEEQEHYEEEQDADVESDEEEMDEEYEEEEHGEKRKDMSDDASDEASDSSAIFGPHKKVSRFSIVSAPFQNRLVIAQALDFSLVLSAVLSKYPTRLPPLVSQEWPASSRLLPHITTA